MLSGEVGVPDDFQHTFKYKTRSYEGVKYCKLCKYLLNFGCDKSVGPTSLGPVPIGSHFCL